MRLPAILALSIPVVALLSQPLWGLKRGIPAYFTIILIGAPIFIIVVPVVYLTVTALYARRLRSLQTRLSAADPTRPALSVWWLVAVPFNFVASFLVIHGIASSMASSGTIVGPTWRRWRLIGMSACALQMVALLPSFYVSLAGLTAGYVLWAAHWVYSVRLDERSRAPEQM